MSNIPELGLVILFIFLLIAFKRLFDMPGPRSSGVEGEPYDLPGAEIGEETPAGNPSEKVLNQSLLSTDVYKEKMKAPESPVREWDDTHRGEDIWRPEHKMPASEYHNIAQPVEDESQNKDFLFHTAEYHDQSVFLTSEQETAKPSAALPDNWSSPDHLRQAFIIKEILDPPVCKRRNKH